VDKKNKNILQEPGCSYEKAETDLLGDALNRTYKERFLMRTQFLKSSKHSGKRKLLPQALLIANKLYRHF